MPAPARTQCLADCLYCAPLWLSKRREKFVGEYFYINLPFVTLLYGFFQLLWVFLWAINMNYPQLVVENDVRFEHEQLIVWGLQIQFNFVANLLLTSSPAPHYNHSLPACICKLTLSPWQWLANQSISVQANRLLTFNIEQQCASYGNNKPNRTMLEWPLQRFTATIFSFIFVMNFAVWKHQVRAIT